MPGGHKKKRTCETMEGSEIGETENYSIHNVKYFFLKQQKKNPTD